MNFLKIKGYSPSRAIPSVGNAEPVRFYDGSFRTSPGDQPLSDLPIPEGWEAFESKPTEAARIRTHDPLVGQVAKSQLHHGCSVGWGFPESVFDGSR